ncbi:MAG: hypothetical protein ACO3LE_07660 [Bdellovibrionota bacterium]
MPTGIPSAEPFVLREIRGSDFFDFAQRIFTRDMRLLKAEEGFMCLLLDPQARLLELFWLYQRSHELFEVIHPASSHSWKENVERYQFSEKFEIGPAQSLRVRWEDSPQPTTSSRTKILDSKSWLASYNQSRLLFSLGDFSKEDLLNWQIYRWENQLLLPSEDASKSRLIFDWGLENFCDANKGCYVGQEIVERVKSRGGASAFEVLKCRWQSPPEADEPISHQEKSVGVSSSSSIPLDAKTVGSFVFTKKGLLSGDLIFGEISGAQGQIVASPKTNFVT